MRWKHSEITRSGPESKSVNMGYVYVVVAAVLWAVSGSSSKFLFNRGMPAFHMVQLRMVISAVTLFAWHMLRNPERLHIRKKDILYFAVFGAFGMAGNQYAYLFAISKINVAAAILLQYLAPILMAGYFVVFARERLRSYTVVAIGGSTIGCWLLVGGYDLNILSMNRVGILAGLASAVTFAWYSLQGEYGMRQYGPWTVHFYALLFGAVAVNLLFPPFAGFFHPHSTGEWLWILYIAVLGTVIPFGLYFEGINLIRSTRAGITATLEPITAGIISYLFLKETMASLQVAGGVLVIFAVILLQVKQEVDDNAPGIIREKSNQSLKSV